MICARNRDYDAQHSPRFQFAHITRKVWRLCAIPPVFMEAPPDRVAVEKTHAAPISETMSRGGTRPEPQVFLFRE